MPGGLLGERAEPGDGFNGILSNCLCIYRYEWHQWTGPIWKRPSVGITWGNDEIAGWGPYVQLTFRL